MKRPEIILALLAGLLVRAAGNGRTAAESSTAANLPAYTSDGKLVAPANYRDWIFLTSGFGLNYSTGPGSNPMFTNVYVAPEAYQGFNTASKLPDQSMFIVETYSPANDGSTNNTEHYPATFS